jgi:hypothetical protein
MPLPPDDPLALLTVPYVWLKLPTGVQYPLDTSRLGRRYNPLGHQLQAVIVKKKLQAAQIAQALGRSKSLMSKLMRLTGPSTSRASPSLISHLTAGLSLDPFDCISTYSVQQYPDTRLLAYPDDPGRGAELVGFPIGGVAAAQARIAWRDRWIAGRTTVTLG